MSAMTKYLYIMVFISYVLLIIENYKLRKEAKGSLKIANKSDELFSKVNESDAKMEALKLMITMSEVVKGIEDEVDEVSSELYSLKEELKEFTQSSGAETDEVKDVLIDLENKLETVLTSLGGFASCVFNATKEL